MQNQWINICKIEDIQPFSGVAAMVNGKQVAIFRVKDEFYAISNYDPFSKAYVLSRGLVGDKAGVVKVASPVYKQSFSLATGECLDDPTIKLPVYPTQVLNEMVHISVP